MALLTNAPPPLGDPIASPSRPEYRGQDPQAGMVTRPWVDWFNNMLTNQEKAAANIATVKLSSQNADITTTDIPTTQPLTAGVYAVKYYLRMQRVDGISANVTLTLRWTWDSTARSWASTTLAANTLTETVSDYVLIEADNNTTVTYETATAFGSGDAFYALTIVLDEVDA